MPLVAHQLALNDLYIAASGKGIEWQQPTAPLSPAVRLIPDIYIDDGQRAFFLEMDLGTEALSIWSGTVLVRKTSAYVKFATTGKYRGHHPPFALCCSGRHREPKSRLGQHSGDTSAKTNTKALLVFDTRHH